MRKRSQNSNQIFIARVTLDLLRNMALYTGHSRVCVSATPPTVFKIMIETCSKIRI